MIDCQPWCLGQQNTQRISKSTLYLWSNDSISVAVMVDRELSVFSNSVHYNTGVFKEIRRKPVMESHAAEENLPSLSRLDCASSSIRVTATISTVKTLASIVLEIILIGVKTREKYHELFLRLQTPNVRLCNEDRPELTGL